MKRKNIAILLAAAMVCTSAGPVWGTEEAYTDDASLFEETSNNISDSISDDMFQDVTDESLDNTDASDEAENADFQDVASADSTDLDTPIDIAHESSVETDVFGADADDVSLFSDGDSSLKDEDVTASTSIQAAFDIDTGILTLSGTGSTGDFSQNVRPSWDCYRDQATQIQITSGITQIGSAAFYGFSKVTSVSLPDTLEGISDGAFAECTSLTSVSLPDSVSRIGNFAFQATQITSLTLPASLTTLSDKMLFGCEWLQELLVSPENPSYLSVDGVVFTKDMTTLCLYPPARSAQSYKVPDSVKTIGVYAFYAANLQTVDLSQVSRLGLASFYKSRLTSIRIPDTVTEMGTSAFSSCGQLADVTIGNGLTQIPTQCFQYCGSLSSIIFGTGIREFGNNSFSYCNSLERIQIPEGVTLIPNGCFGQSASLKEVVFPSSLKEIRYQAFMGCPSLNQITLPEALISIGRYAFYNTGITSVVLPYASVTVGDHAFPDTASVSIRPDTRVNPADELLKTASRVPINITYDYESASQLVALVNQQRSAKGLSPLTMDTALLDAAMKRAGELSVLYSHTRPIGVSGLTACLDASYESISAGQGTASEALAVWMNGDDQAGIFNADYTAAGVGAITAGGVSYWVLLYGKQVTTPADMNAYTSSTVSAEIPFISSSGIPFKFYATGNMKLGLSERKEVEFFIDNGFSHVQISPSALTFASASPSVCRVSSSGILTPKRAGKARITITLKGDSQVTTALTVTVDSRLRTPKIHTVKATSSRSLRIMWDKIPGAASYTLYYKEGNAKSWKVLQKGIKRNGYNHRYLTPGTTYTYTVRAVSKTGTSRYDSKGKKGIPKAIAPALKKVSSLSANRNLISWKKVADADGYRIYIKKGKRWKLLGSTDASTTSFIHISSRSFPVAPGKINTYTVRAFTNTGNRQVLGSYLTSGITAATPLPRVTLRIPKSVSQGIRLSWKRCSGATGYVIYRYENKGWKKAGVSRSLTYTDTKAVKGSTYRYRVRAYSRSGQNVVYGRSSSTKSIKHI